MLIPTFIAKLLAVWLEMGQVEKLKVVILATTKLNPYAQENNLFYDCFVLTGHLKRVWLWDVCTVTSSLTFPYKIPRWNT